MRNLSLVSAIFLLGTIASSQTIHSRGGFTLPSPPDVESVPVTDNYFGTKIVDNYRWLEDANSADTKAFIDAENAYTARYMEQARIHPQIANDMDALEHVSMWKVPILRGNDQFFERCWPARIRRRSMCAMDGLRKTNGSSTRRSSAAIPTRQ
ncbi:MAG: hypothetical protein WDM87_05895 [Terracidiphilus sp.]